MSVETVVEILCIGREILDGRVIDTNSTTIAQTISKIGLRPQYGQKVDDDAKRIHEAFTIAQSRSDIVIVCGGLGPTSDDRTLDLFALFGGVKMIEYPSAISHLRQYLAERGRPVTAAQMKQTLFPEGGETLANPHGTACGFLKTQGETQWFFLPGPPRELLPMMENEVVPRLSADRKFLNRAWITQFIAESELQQKLNSVIKRLPQNWDLSFQTRFPEVAIGLHSPSEDNRADFDSLVAEIREALEGTFWYEGENSRSTLEERIVELLKRENIMLGTVESCTGGLISKRITDVPGCSAVFAATWVTYANEAKVALGVSAKTLENFGAVSPQVAAEMAESGLKALQNLGKEPQRAFCLSVTGIAGPDGASEEKSVGLCFIGLADSASSTLVAKVEAPQKLDRGRNRRYFSQKALTILGDRLLNS